MMGTMNDHGVNFDLAKLRHLFGPEGNRASLVRLLKAAEELGYTTFIAALDWEDLKQERRPIITRVLKQDSWDDYVMIQTVTGDEVVTVDGELNVRRLSRKEFGRLWTGWVVILQRRLASTGA
jgi:ABC-type bacteriocin/lantibiotic exporter with double-glycine peptidase domain